MMVQRMLDNKKFESKLKKSIGIQTGDENERCLTISGTKKFVCIIQNLTKIIY